MSNRSFTWRIIFLLCLAASTALSLPVVMTLQRVIRQAGERAIAAFEEQTGLVISYKHLSPAIFLGLNITDITVSLRSSSGIVDGYIEEADEEHSLSSEDNRQDAAPIIAVRRLTLSYDLRKLIKRDIEGAFTSLLINGVDINYDEASDNAAVSHIKQLVAALQTKPDESGSAPTAIIDTVRKVTNMLHLNVLVRKVTVRYKGHGASATAFFNRLTLRRERGNRGNVKRSLRFTCDGEASGSAVGTVADGQFKADVTIKPDIDDSTAILRLRNFNAAPAHLPGAKGDKLFVSMKAMNILTRYNDGTLSLETIQSALPLSLRCALDSRQSTVAASLRMSKLPLSRVVMAEQRGSTLDTALDTVITTNTDINITLPQEDRELGIGYYSVGEVTLPSRLTGGTVQYSASGDDRSVRLSRLIARGTKCDVEGNLTYVFRPMQLSGDLDIKRLTLPSGAQLTAELLFDPLEKGFAVFSPMIEIAGTSPAATDTYSIDMGEDGGEADKADDMGEGIMLNALVVQVMPRSDSVDFSAEVSDYSHAVQGAEPGVIRIDGSYLMRTHGALASLTVQQYYLDSLASLAQGIMMPPDALPAQQDKIMARLAPLMFQGEAYVSADKNGILYNVPYAVVANTEEEGQALYLSLDGNKDSISVSQLDIAYGKHGANITADVFRNPDGTGTSFNLDLALLQNDTPYRFTGDITNSGSERFITVTDDYGSVFQAVLHPQSVEGSLTMASFPVSIGRTLFALSTETGFAWNETDGIAVHVARFESMATSGDVLPRFVMSGEVNKYGAFFDNMSYTDAFSALEGNAAAFLNMNDGLFDSARLDFNLASPVSGETITFGAEVTNSSRLPLTLNNVKESFYIDSTLSLHQFALSRWLSEHSDNNSLTASLVATGTIANPYISLNVERAAMMFAGILLTSSGNISVIDKELTVADTKVRYGSVNVSDVSAGFSLETFTGQSQAMLDIGLDKSLFSMPMTLAVMDTGISPKTHLPTSFTAVLETKGATGALINEALPFDITVMRSEHDTAVFSSDNLGISGYFADGGDMSINSESDLLGFHITGKNDWQNLDFNIGDININIAAIASRFKNPAFAMYRGRLTGSLDVGGIRSDPDFNGTLAIDAPDFSLLKVVPYHITGDKVLMQARHSQIDIPESALIDSGQTVFVGGKIMFDRWMFDNMELYVRTPTGKSAPALLDAGVATFEGDASLDLNVGIDRNKTLEVTGNVYVEDTKANVRAREVINIGEANKSPLMSRRINVDITMGPHVFVTLDPLLRALLTPNSKVNFQLDEASDSFAIEGDVGIKSGDIAWFNRSFYLKSGTIHLNDNEDSFDPVITLRAETRDRDDDGKDVKITMTATNQRLSSFSPKFTSVPVKSEAEIRAMLGQIAIGDSGNASDIMLSMGDFAVAATVGRAVENTIRDIFNFDIFSIRTMALQNVFKNSLIGDEQGNNKITAGNLLDNSTVYIGKYIGSVIYLDAMLHLSYDEYKEDSINSTNGISFQPEIGFELDAPFAGIRWSMAPNIDAMKQSMFMPMTSVTLSWGFSF